MRQGVAACAVVLLSAASCSSGDPMVSPTGPSTVTVKTSDHAYDVPPSFSGGLVELTLDNSAGTESHEAQLIRLDEGKGLPDFRTAFAQGHPPDWAHLSGGPGPVEPGARAVYQGALPAGTYVLMCEVPSPDGQTHMAKGMLAEVTVTAGADGTLPEGDATISTSEFTFAGYEELSEGTQTVRVVNEGADHHHVVVFSLAPRKRLADALAFFEGKAASPIADRIGLVGGMAPGVEAARTLELARGQTYVLACFITDDNGTPHAFKGMVAEFTL